MLCLEAVTATEFSKTFFVLTAVLCGSLHHFSDPPGLHRQGSSMKPWWRWSQSLKRWCIWTTWHGCQPERVLVCTSMKRMPLFSLSSWNCGSEIHPTGTSCLSAVWRCTKKERPEKYSRRLLLCHNSALAHCSLHA